jgi:hypothetical protein
MASHTLLILTNCSLRGCATPAGIGCAAGVAVDWKRRVTEEKSVRRRAVGGAGATTVA